MTLRTVFSFLTGVVLASLSMAPLGAQNPVIGTAGVVNAASGLDGFTVGIAQGSYFLVLGTGLATSTTGLASFPLPTTFGGAQVRVRSVANNTSYDVPLYFASPTQINGILPSTVPVGQADLTVTVGSVTSRANRIQVQRTRVGIFTIFNQPSGQGLVQNYDSATQVRLNQYLSPARNGQTMIIWATGLGPYTAGPDNQPPAAGTIADNVEVLVAGLSIRPFYAGRAPGIPGFDQINFTLPNNAPIPDGCTVTLQIRVGIDVSNVTTIAKAGTGDVCVHSMGLTREALQRLDQGGTVSAGLIALTRETSATSGGPGLVLLTSSEKFSALFSRFNAGTAPLIKEGIGVNLPFAGIGLAPGACALYQVPPSKPPQLSLNLPDSRTSGTDTGNLTLEGQGKSKSFSSEGNGVYKAEIGQRTEIPGIDPQGELFLSDGVFTVRGSGGRVIGPFSAQVQFTNRITVSNDDRPLFIPRNQPVTVRWTGGGNSDGDLITLTAIGAPSGQGDLKAYVCSLRATARSYTIPSDIIGQYPANSLVYFNVFSSPASSQTRFTAPLVAGGSLDSGMAGIVLSEQWASFVQ